ncbi:MAG: peptidylprolyl isomerase [Sedimentitalea sp.]|nr:peptidylprolyl isomerase [Sedimentitalea sp.]
MRNLTAALALIAGPALVLGSVSPALATGLVIEIAGEGANGTVTIDLLEDVAPNHVAQIAALAEDGAYDGVVFHRVIDGFMAQTGDVKFGKLGGDMSRAGMGGSDRPNLDAEFSDLPFERGVVGMARSQDPNSANSQFFIMFDEGAFLNGQYTVVGRVTDGMDVVDAIKRGKGQNGAVIGQPDVMTSVRVTD